MMTDIWTSELQNRMGSIQMFWKEGGTDPGPKPAHIQPFRFMLLGRPLLVELLIQIFTSNMLKPDRFLIWALIG